LGLEESVAQQGPSDEYYDSLNYFSNIRTYSEWQISDKAVTPRLRVHFTGFRGNVIFDTSFDWDDAINVAYRLTQQVREDVEHLNLLTPQAQKTVDLKNEFGDRIPKRISAIVKDLREIRDKFCELGFSRDDFDFE
jgi:hypothetical protein